MYKKTFASMLIVFLIFSLLSINISAYSLSPNEPGTNIFPYYINTTVPTSARNNIQLAAQGLSNYKWGSTLVISYKGTRQGSVSWQDSRSEIAYLNISELSTQSGWEFLASSNYAVAVTVVNGSPYNYFDIILNSYFGSIWGNGSGTVTINGTQYCIIDYQGIVTHELGHAVGLNDTYWVPTTETYPTMFYNVKRYPSTYGAPHPFELRTLEPDDRRGLDALGY
jgi:hypothetical protein